jgi:hypothetical protein
LDAGELGQPYRPAYLRASEIDDKLTAQMQSAAASGEQLSGVSGP